jgi:hypothetical protein
MEHKDPFKEQLETMEVRLSEMEDKIDVIDVKLTQVVDAILGNPLTKTGGFINDIEILKQKIAELEKKQEKHDDFKKRIYWTIGIVVAVLMALQYITNIYANIKH